MKKYAAELIGTFILVFVGTGAIMANQTGAVTLLGVALAWGLTVTAMIYALGSTSGCHLNPAVTIGLWVSKRFSTAHVIPYIVVQCGGALLASLAVRQIYGDHSMLGATMPSGDVMQTFWLEVALTFFLIFTVLLATSGAKEKTALAGLAIGGVVTFDILCGGPISGASMNPARSLGPAIVSGHTEHLWVYMAAPVAGSVLAVLASMMVCSCCSKEACDTGNG